ncbi:MAG: hypothetical protein RR295_07395 [Oscillospiraceae bacterium]
MKAMSQYTDRNLLESLEKTVEMRKKWTDFNEHQEKIRNIDEGLQPIQNQFRSGKEQDPNYVLPDEAMQKLKIGTEERKNQEDILASMQQPLDAIAPLIQAQKGYWGQLAYNERAARETETLTKELETLTAETQNSTKDEYTKQQQQLKEQLQKNLQKQKDMYALLKTTNAMIRKTEEHVLSAEQHAKDHYDPEAAEKDLQEVQAELEVWKASSEQLYAEQSTLFESETSLQKQLGQTEQVIAKFARMDAIQEKLSQLKDGVAQPNEKEYQERQAQLTQAWTKINLEMLEPLKVHIQEGLKDMNLPPLDFAGKDKDNVLCWDERSKSFQPLFNQAVALFQKEQTGALIRTCIGNPNFIQKKIKEYVVRQVGEIQVYPDDHATEPYRVNMGDTKEQFAEAAPPTEPKEPGRGAKFLNWVAGLFGKTNATCDQYRRDMETYHKALAAFELPQEQKDGLKQLAEQRKEAVKQRAEKQADGLKPLSKAERLAAIEPIKQEKKPELTPKIRSVAAKAPIFIEAKTSKQAKASKHR